MMKDLYDLLKQEVKKKSVFVFPSEAAASAWKKEFLKISGKNAVLNARFLSWDSFKEKIIPKNLNEKPVNSEIRRFFASTMIEKNSVQDIFTKIIPKAYSKAAGGFSDSICRMLPELQKLIDLLTRTNYGKDFPSEDFIRLYQHYIEFMKNNLLFEPSWKFAEIDSIIDKHYIIAPNIIEDFNEYEASLKKVGCEFFYPNTNQLKNKISVFENTVIEADFILNEIRTYLKNGVPSYEILVSCADENLADILISKSKIQGIPLFLKSGRPLLEYPAGRLPFLIMECKNSNFSLTSMKNLLMFRAFIWKDSKLANSLIRFGIENRCFKNTGYRKEDDEWEKRLSAAKEYDVLKFYKMLKKRINSFCQSNSFNKLATELQIFISTFLITDNDEWDAECEMIFQRCREILSSLCLLEDNLEGVYLKNPLAIWIKILNEKIYVKQKGSGGISVYRYRVSALVTPKYHFICGLSDGNAKISSSPFSFLTDQQRELFSVLENNMSDDFIKIYGLSGENIKFSTSLETPSGTALVPSFFVRNNRLIKEITSQRDPFMLENLWWGNACLDNFDNSLYLTAVQKEGFVYALQTCFKPKDFDVTSNIISLNEKTEKLLKNLYNTDGYIKISSTALSKWINCPFAFFIDKVLKIREQDYLLFFEDPLEEGNIFHTIFYNFFSKLKSADQVFKPSLHRQEYIRQIIEISQEVFSEWEESKNYFFGPAWTAFKKKCQYLIVQFVLKESELYGGFFPAVLEEYLHFVLEDEKVMLHGLVDRISTKGEEAILVDYKRNWNKKSRKSFIKYDEDDNLLSPEVGHQIPIYIMLAQSQGINITGASYYGISQEKYFPVFGNDGILDEFDISELCSKTLEDVIDMAESIKKYDFRAPKRCDGCELRSICRKKFNVGLSL